MFILKSNARYAVPLANSKEVDTFLIAGIEGVMLLDNPYISIQRLVDSNYLQEGNY